MKIEPLKLKVNLSYAIQVAFKAHEGQVDKALLPYILHPLRIMEKMDTEQLKIIAVLHDVVEDTNLSLLHLKSLGFDKEILEALDSLTRREDESYPEFIQRVKANPLAIKVKIEDIKDNLDVTRLDHLTSKDLSRIKRYHKALKELGL